MTLDLSYRAYMAIIPYGIRTSKLIKVERIKGSAVTYTRTASAISIRVTATTSFAPKKMCRVVRPTMFHKLQNNESANNILAHVARL